MRAHGPTPLVRAAGEAVGPDVQGEVERGLTLDGNDHELVPVRPEGPGGQEVDALPDERAVGIRKVGDVGPDDLVELPDGVEEVVPAVADVDDRHHWNVPSI